MLQEQRKDEAVDVPLNHFFSRMLGRRNEQHAVIAEDVENLVEKEPDIALMLDDVRAKDHVELLVEFMRDEINLVFRRVRIFIELKDFEPSLSHDRRMDARATADIETILVFGADIFAFADKKLDQREAAPVDLVFRHFLNNSLCISEL